MHMKLYHATYKFLGKEAVLNPRKLSDTHHKGICLARSPGSALVASMKRKRYVYVCDSEAVALKKSEVWDAQATGEVYVTSPVKVHLHLNLKSFGTHFYGMIDIAHKFFHEFSVDISVANKKEKEAFFNTYKRSIRMIDEILEDTLYL